MGEQYSDAQTTKENLNGEKSKTQYFAIFAAIITGGAIITAALINNVDWGSGSAELSVRISDREGAAISDAEVIYYFDGTSIREFSNSNGLVTTSIAEIDGTKVQVVVQAEGYERYEQSVNLSVQRDVDVRLSKLNPEENDVVIRVLDEYDSTPISGAEVTLILESDVFRQATDSFGITKFSLPFSTEVIDVQISIEISGYKIDNQNITLNKDRNHDILLDSENRTFKLN